MASDIKDWNKQADWEDELDSEDTYILPGRRHSILDDGALESYMAAALLRPDNLSVGAFIVTPPGYVVQPDAPRWRIELSGEEPGIEPLRLEIVGDTVLGRSAGADVNLHRYGVGEFGISRRHALLRPSTNALYLIDLKSSNGTQYNGIRVGDGEAIPLAVNGVIQLARLAFTIRFLGPAA